MEIWLRGKPWEYDVPIATAAQFRRRMRAGESPGHLYHQLIKGHVPGRPLAERDPPIPF